MLVGTHALLPVCGCLIVDHVSVISGGDRVFPAKALWMVAVFGILPDVCSPHIMLEDRHTSYTHSVWFMGVVVLLAVITGMFFEKGRRLWVAMACWCATALHLLADAVSGGIAWLYPWREDVIGRFYIDLDYWAWSEAVFVLLAWVLIRMLPHLEARNIRKSHSTISS